MPKTLFKLVGLRARLIRGAISLVLAIAVVMGGMFVLARVVPGLNPFGISTQARSTEVIQAVTTEKQVILLRLGIEGIEERKSEATIGGVKIPWTDRALFLRYSFDAQLGMEGKDVQITRTGDHAYRLTVPPFIFLGHNNVHFSIAAQKDGVLSWTTPKLDEVEMVNAILNSDAQQQYLDKYQDALREQAQEFYRGIIQSVDSSAEVSFDFRA